MAWRFRPAVYKGSTLTFLPRPIHKLTFPTTWKFDKHEVPLKSGCITYGHTIASDQIILQGHIGHVAGNTKISEEEMFTAFETLRGVFNVTSRSELFEFFIYHDDTAMDTLYRKFKNVCCVAFDIEMGDADRVIWPWSAVLEPEDRTIYTTAPGA